jgi:cysteinyl-tRNA synthetase
VQINQEKMSKSLGNFFTIREIFEKSEWPEAETGEQLRYFLLATQYRGPLDFSDQALKEAKNAVNGFYDLFARLAETGGNASGDAGLNPAIERCTAAFQSAMDDDINTPVAIAALQGLRSDLNRLLAEGLSTDARRTAREAFRSLGRVLALFQLDHWVFNVETGGPLSLASEVEIERQIAERTEAKKRKDFKRADAIRAELAAQGIILEDKPDGTSRWKR